MQKLDCSERNNCLCRKFYELPLMQRNLPVFILPLNPQYLICEVIFEKYQKFQKKTVKKPYRPKNL